MLGEGQFELPAHLPSLYGTSMTLRAPIESDVRAWFEWRQDIENLHLWSVFRRVVSFEEATDEFRGMLRNTIVLMIEAEPRSPEGPVGFVQAYSISQVDGHAHLLLYADPRRTARRISMEAVARFSDYLFTYLNLRKLYADVFEFNRGSLDSLRTAGFQEEGCLKQHVYFAGRYWNQYKLAMYAEDADSLRERFSALLQHAKNSDIHPTNGERSIAR